MNLEDFLSKKCERRDSATCTQDGSFEAWLHGCHYLAVKSGIMYFYKGRYKTYPGRGDKNDRRTVIISPCFQESDLKMWLSAEELLDEKVNKAIALAREAHWSQRRDDGSPYLEQHVYPVAAMMLSEGRLPMTKGDESFNKKKAVIVALLHDTLEDSDMTESKIKNEFGAEIYQMVKALTKKRPWESEFDMVKYMARINAAPVEARVVKLADRLNNVFCLQYSSEEKRKWYLEETVRWYLPLAKRTSPYFSVWYREVLESLGYS
ncbi:MAG: bifunctional (p)ppGpp synthetase/guanosine-3',5'-bis(diphosphate) 3'-pyrophosphohydrolase [Euryarchaeota archaeon]|nr:bifunctional (p)ppGpp synthetase/guanosine-3',5'-bis(diphosphate) 3'-pyrophosphohydrolase [Euryarchaeota archaeon]